MRPSVPNVDRHTAPDRARSARRYGFAAAALLLGLLAPRQAAAQDGANVLVVANERAPASLAIASYYAEKRAVPHDQILILQTTADDTIGRSDYNRQIAGPIAAWLNGHDAQDRILYIVLTKGIPLRIAGTRGRDGTGASVDSELTLLYRRMTGGNAPISGPAPNPFFLGGAPIDRAAPFSHAGFDLYLVTRLDGFNATDAMALVDRGLAPAAGGRVLLERPARDRGPTAAWLDDVAPRLAQVGDKSMAVVHEDAEGASGSIFGYVGSGGPGDLASTPMAFARGALAMEFAGADAHTFAPPPLDPAAATLASMRIDPPAPPEPLIARLVHVGASGVAGNVDEPYLDSLERPDILFPTYAAGHNLAEAFYLALPSLSWQAVIVGDPLCAPFSRPAIPNADLNPPIDPETGLPRYFSKRRTDVLVAQGIPAPAARLLLLADTRTAHDDRAGALRALEQAAANAPDVAGTWRALAMAYERAGQHDRATDAYRKIIALDPHDAGALNNIAYALAVRDGKPQQALPFAEKAYLFAPGQPDVADTLAWIRHLLGDEAAAFRLLRTATGTRGAGADVYVHLAIVSSTLGRDRDAQSALEHAAALDPAIAQRADYLAVQQKLRGRL